MFTVNKLNVLGKDSLATDLSVVMLLRLSLLTDPELVGLRKSPGANHYQKQR